MVIFFRSGARNGQGDNKAKDNASVRSFNRSRSRHMLSDLYIDDDLGPDPDWTGQSQCWNIEDKECHNALSRDKLASLDNGTSKWGSRNNFSPLTITKVPLVTFQIIPHRFTSNDNVHLLLVGMQELYQPPLMRFKLSQNRVQYTPPQYFVWEVWLETKKIQFFLHVPALWGSYTKHKIGVAWPKATVLEASKRDLPEVNTSIWESELKNHYIFPLEGHRASNYFATLLDTVRLLQPGEQAVLQVVVQPLGCYWQEEALKSYYKFKKGLLPKRWKLKSPLYYLGLGLNSVLYEMVSFIGDFFGARIAPPQFEEQESISLRFHGNILNKIRQPLFDVTVRVAVHSSDQNKSKVIAHNVISSLSFLEGENGFKFKKVLLPKAITSFNNRENILFKINPDILSLEEIKKIILLPPAVLQAEYPEIEQVEKREILLPKILTKGGLLIGHVVYKGVEQEIYLPTNNLDELCLPHIVIGGMGTGKTSFGANLAIQAIRNNMGAIIIDPAKGEAGDEVELAVPSFLIKRIRFGQQVISLDWREALHNVRGKNRFASELLSFFEVASDEMGLQTSRYLRAAAKAVPSCRLQDIVSLFSDPIYRRKLLNSMRDHERETWENYDTLSEARQNQIAHPVYNRLDIILGDDYLAECMEAREGLDFVELLKEPKVIVLDIPKRDLGSEAVDVLATLLITKISLAMVLRDTNFPVFIIQDEPHQYMKSYRTWRSVAVESRKWRFCYVWMFHAWEQIPRDLANIIRSANPHYHIYTSSEATYRALAEEIKPFDIQEALNTPRHYAINVIRAEGKTLTPFIAKMLPPPSKTKGRR